MGLTGAGRDLVPKLAPRVTANNAKFLKGLTDEDQAAFERLIQKMLTNAEVAVYSNQELQHP